MKCEKCGYESSDAWEQCPNCNPRKEFVLFCSGCGNKLNEDHIFCPKCGKAVQKDAEATISPSREVNIQKNANAQKEKSKLKQAILRFILGGIGICLLIIIIMILIGDWFDIIFEVMTTISYLVLFGYIANTLVNLYEKTDYDVVAASGLTLCGILFGILILELWDIIDLSKIEILSKFLVSLGISLVGFWHSAKLLCIEIRNNDAEKAQKITIPILIITYLLIIIISFFELEIDILFRIMVILIIITIFGSISIPILNKIKKDR